MSDYNLIILNFESGDVLKYNIENFEQIEDVENFITDELGLSLGNIEFMYNCNNFITEKYNKWDLTKK